LEFNEKHSDPELISALGAAAKLALDRMAEEKVIDQYFPSIALDDGTRISVEELVHILTATHGVDIVDHSFLSIDDAVRNVFYPTDYNSMAYLPGVGGTGHIWCWLVRGDSLKRFIHLFAKEIRARICKDDSSDKSIDSSIAASITALTTWLFHEFNVSNALANGMAVAILVTVVAATKGAFCKMTTDEVASIMATTDAPKK
jgi:hypothetical protein